MIQLINIYRKKGLEGRATATCTGVLSTSGKACNWTDFHAESETIMRGVQWSGMEAFEFDDGELGLLLDLDSGTLTAYKDGRRLGVMKDVSMNSWHCYF